MAPEVNVVEGQNLCEERVRHKRSKSESHRDPASAQNPGSVFQEYFRGSHGPKKEAGLAEDGLPGDRSCQHIHEEKAHFDPLNKQLELFSNSADISETRTNTTSSDTLSENEHPNSKAHFEQVQDAEATSKRELELERNAHSGTKAELQSITTSLEAVEKRLKEKTRSYTALAGLHKDAQQRVKEREQHIEYLKFDHEHQYQSLASAKDEDLRALQIQLESVTKKSAESLKVAKAETEVATRERDEACKSCEISKSRLAAVMRGNEDRTLSMQEQLDGRIRQLDAQQKQLDATQDNLDSMQDELAENRIEANKIISKLQKDLQIAIEDCQASRDLFEAERLLNKALNTKNNQLEKRSTDAKEKLKETQAGSSRFLIVMKKRVLT